MQEPFSFCRPYGLTMWGGGDGSLSERRGKFWADSTCQIPNVELIYSPGRERGEGFGAAEGRAGLPLGEDDKRGSGHLVPADGWEGQGGEVPGWAGLRRTQILLVPWGQ